MASVTMAPGGVAVAGGDRWTGGLGVVAAILLGVGPVAGLLLGVEISGPDAPAQVTQFYADRASWMPMLVIEPIGLAGVAVFLWFVGRLQAALALGSGDGAASAGAANAPHILLGGAVFAALYVVWLLGSTTVAGSLAFAPAFQPDPHVAMLLSHLGYVALVGAMLGAATIALSVARIARHDASLPRTLRPASIVVAVLAFLSLFFVVVPFLVFVAWLAVLGLIAGRRASTAAERSAA